MSRVIDRVGQKPLSGKEALTQVRLKETLHYDSATGEFFWRVDKGPAKIGDRAGSVHNKGYWRIAIDGKLYLGHRLAWLYMHGHFPKELDHINRVRSDNRIANLREATRNENRRNSKTYKNNRAGLKGAHPSGSRWVSSVRHNGKTFYLGLFPTPELAHKVYCYAAKRLHGEFFCDGKERDTP